MNGAMVVTPLYAALLALWLVVLSLRAITSGRSAQARLDEGGTGEAHRALRGDASLAQHVLLALLLLLIVELSRFSIHVVHALGIMLIVAQLFHGYALAFGRQSPFGRGVAVALTLAVLIAEAVLCLYQAWRGHYVWLAA